MDLVKFKEVVTLAATERGCELVELMLNDDDNVFEVVIDRKDGNVDLGDCEYIHRAVLAAFDRNIEDYALTVGSAGIDAAEADEMLKTINE
ncbi:MAG: hypothetical protein SPH70_02605 [Candidatus Cryptobacteroides sp.]|nr:hypothetical protein [Bacteroidales bacterium]MDY6157953.1 hypothetical protein [Candidatus Cryptobacteroides sp.]